MIQRSMIQKTVTFQDQMMMSEGSSNKTDIEKILLSAFPNAIKVEKADTVDDKHGTDYWVYTEAGQKYSVDLKVRDLDYSKKDPRKDDLALEVWSKIGVRIGWTRDTNKRTDYILWIWLDSGRWMLAPFPMLCSVFTQKWLEWTQEYFAPIQITKNNDGSGWKSQCVFVPRKVVWRVIFDSFGGSPKPRQVNTRISPDKGMERAKSGYNARGEHRE